MTTEKKGSKLFTMLIKILGKKGSMDVLVSNTVDALDTNKDGQLTADDFKGEWWKLVSWWKLSFSIAGVAGLVYFGLNNWQTLLKILLTALVGE